MQAAKKVTFRKKSTNVKFILEFSTCSIEKPGVDNQTNKQTNQKKKKPKPNNKNKSDSVGREWRGKCNLKFYTLPCFHLSIKAKDRL
jgi:hypothetical protein